MTPQRRSRSVLLGLALGVLLALFLSPATRWLLRAQVAAGGLSFQSPAAQVRRQQEAERRAAAQASGDFPLQLAAALKGNSNAERAASLRTLLPRFGSNPSLYANLLRYEVGNSESKTGVYLSRSEDWTFSADGPPRDYKAPPPPAPAVLAQFDADAAVGERLDPNNAFFPLMRAVGLLAAHRDAEGLDAVLRAGQKSGWREYIGDEVYGRLHLAEAATGGLTAMQRIAVAASELYPHYAGLRAVARVATAKAVQAEPMGQPEQGMAIRRAVMHCGDLMRVQSTVYIGSLVGIAISAIAIARPGGAPPLPYHSTGGLPHEIGQGDAERHRLDQLQAFCDYARRIGAPQDAGRAQAEFQAGLAARAVFDKGPERSVFGGTQMVRLGAWWVADLLTLANALWLLALGLAAAGLARLPAVRGRRPMPRPALSGVVVGLLALVFAAFGHFGPAELQPLVTFVSAVLAAPVAAVLAIRLLRAPSESRGAWRRGAGQFVRAIGLTLLALALLGALAAGQVRGVLGFSETLNDITVQSGSDSPADSAANQPQEMEVTVVGCSLAVPLLMLLVLSIAGRIRRVPVSAALVQGFGAGAVPVACVLVLVYGGLTLGTLRQERAMDDGLQQMVQHEGRYYAALAGVPWPGPVP